MTDQQQPRPPLWLVMEETFANDVGEFELGDGFSTTCGDPDGGTWAAMIRKFSAYLEVHGLINTISQPTPRSGPRLLALLEEEARRAEDIEGCKVTTEDDLRRCRELFGALYQILGAHEASEEVLTVVSDASTGSYIENAVEKLLPYSPPSPNTIEIKGRREPTRQEIIKLACQCLGYKFFEDEEDILDCATTDSDELEDFARAVLTTFR